MKNHCKDNNYIFNSNREDGVFNKTLLFGCFFNQFLNICPCFGDYSWFCDSLWEKRKKKMPRLQLWLGNRGIDGDAYVLGIG
jgi:hypothetical protein